LPRALAPRRADANVRINPPAAPDVPGDHAAGTDPKSCDLAEQGFGPAGRLVKVGVHNGDISVGGSIETVEATANLLGAQFEVKRRHDRVRERRL
jgi:hypothetical protein